MRVVATTADGWRATVRSVRWSPILLIPATMSLALLVVPPLARPGSGPVGLLGEAGLAFTAIGAAFIADDPTTEAAPATPIEARLRLALRACVAAPVLLGGWLTVLWLYNRADPEALAEGLTGRTLLGLGLAVAAVAVSTVAGRRLAVASPGAVGAGALVACCAFLPVAPVAWARALPPSTTIWTVAILAGLATITAATKEPSR